MERIDWSAVDRMIDIALEEDLGDGDITTLSTVRPGIVGIGQVTAKQPCVAAGLFLVERIYQRIDPEVSVTVLIEEGRKVSSGTVLCRLDGPVRSLLMGERTVLNFLQRICGTATFAARFVRAVRKTSARIYDTRKTTPGLRTLEKYAVRAAGGCNHRMGLYDAVLIKENHVAAAGSVDRAIKKVRRAHKGLPIEVEVRNFEELVLAVEYGADIVLLDNMNAGQIRKAASLVGDRVELEVSGGVNLRSARRIAETGVSRISVGALTHSAPAVDLSMMIIPD